MAQQSNKPSNGKGSGEWTAGLYSGAGILILLAITIGINMIAGGSAVRKDFTEDRIFTLSEGSRNILKKLDTQVTLRFFATKDQDNMPPVFRSFARRIEDMLSEYDKVGGKFVKLEYLDPEPLSDAEDMARLHGIEAQNIDLNDRIYLGLSVQMLDKISSIPFLALNRENMLEYDISRMISEVTTTTKSKIGLISSLPIMGEPMNPMMMQMGQRGSEKWVVMQQIEQLFEVEDLTTSVESIPEDVDLLLVVHPKDLQDTTLYALDQYIMNGGKMIVMVDPAAVVDQSGANPQNPMQAAMQNNSNLQKLFSAWGIEFTSQVVADLRYQTRISSRNPQGEENPAVLTLDREALDQADILTSELDNLTLLFSGAFTGEPVEGLKKSDIINSSTQNKLVEGFMAQMGGESISKDFVSDDKKYALASRLSGVFPTAFPDGKPAGSPDDGTDGTDSDAGGSDKHLAKSTGSPTVLLVGDVDFIFDRFAFQTFNFFNQRIAQPMNGNSSLFLSMIEQLAGDENLIAIRGRATLSRPFTKFKELRLAAQQKVKAEQEQLEAELEKAQTEINKLQSLKKEGSQALVVSPEQKKAIEEFKKKEFETSQKLKEIQKQLNRDSEAVQRFWQIVQIVLVPLAVALLGLVTAFVKRVKTAAK